MPQLNMATLQDLCATLATKKAEDDAARSLLADKQADATAKADAAIQAQAAVTTTQAAKNAADLAVVSASDAEGVTLSQVNGAFSALQAYVSSATL